MRTHPNDAPQGAGPVAARRASRPRTEAPVELFIAALGSCAAFYAGRYLSRHGLDREGLQVTAEFVMASDGPARVRSITLKIGVPGGISSERQRGLLAVASHCTVHNTLREAPEISIELA